MDQRADSGNDQHHGHAEGIDADFKWNGEITDGDPFKEGEDD